VNGQSRGGGAGLTQRAVVVDVQRPGVERDAVGKAVVGRDGQRAGSALSQSARSADRAAAAQHVVPAVVERHRAGRDVGVELDVVVGGGGVVERDVVAVKELVGGGDLPVVGGVQVPGAVDGAGPGDVGDRAGGVDDDRGGGADQRPG